MIITLFGGAGFLGAQIARSLLRQGNEVRIFDKPGAKMNPHAFGLDQAVWLEGDFANSLDVKKAVAGSDIILHLISTTLKMITLSMVEYNQSDIGMKNTKY